jgi:uncharacterized protein YbjT (DUF2867 family)
MTRISNMKILILGGQGRIGSLIADALRSRLPQAHIIRTTRKAPAPAAISDFQWLQFDPFQDDWAQLPQVDVLINAIGAIRATKAMPFSKVHEGLTALILQHRASLGHPRIVQVSAVGADPGHKAAFLATKGHADALLLTAPDTAILRPSIVCTPGTMLSKRLDQLIQIARIGFGKLLVPAGFPATRVQPIAPDDLGRIGAALALDKSILGAVEAVGPVAYSFEELLQAKAAAQGLTLKLVGVPKAIMEGFVQHFVAVWFPQTLSRDQFRLLFEDNVGDPSRAAWLNGQPLQDSMPFWKGLPWPLQPLEHSTRKQVVLMEALGELKSIH